MEPDSGHSEVSIVSLSDLCPLSQYTKSETYLVVSSVSSNLCCLRKVHTRLGIHPLRVLHNTTIALDIYFDTSKVGNLRIVPNVTTAEFFVLGYLSALQNR